MRNYDPCAVWYHIHQADHWLPLIRDLKIPLPIGEQEELKTYEKFEEWKKKNVDKEEDFYKVLGEFMKPFQSFYGPKQFEKELTEK